MAEMYCFRIFAWMCVLLLVLRADIHYFPWAARPAGGVPLEALMAVSWKLSAASPVKRVGLQETQAYGCWALQTLVGCPLWVLVPKALPAV
jgi:hypothetical protein